MKILKIIFIVVGLALIGVSLYNFIASESIIIESIKIDKKTNPTENNIWMLAIGIITLLAGTMIKER